LKSPPSLQVRPTSDRLRETLFNIIAPKIEGTRLLVLCAGSGAVGIEALSRGARHVTFVDRSRKMFALIEANLGLCKIAKEEWQIAQAEAADFLRQALRQVGEQAGRGTNEPWDIVFFDPPYATDYLPILEAFGADASTLLTENGLLVVEHHHKNPLPNELAKLRRTRVLKQGDSALSFYNVK
jgi:16S rRNA (guanine966-N2)-methyltransferase